MPELDVAGIAGGALQGFLQGKNQAAQTQLQRAEFEHQKEQDRIREEREKELMDHRRKMFGDELETSAARKALLLEELGNTRDTKQSEEVMRRYIKTISGKDPEEIKALQTLGELRQQQLTAEATQASTASSRASAGAAAASAEASRANTRGQNIQNQILEKELGYTDINQELKRLQAWNNSGFDIKPEVAETLTGAPKGMLTNTPKGGLGTDPLGIAENRAQGAFKMFREGAISEETALGHINTYAGMSHIANGGKPEDFKPVEKLDKSKPLDLSDVLSIHRAITGTDMFGKTEPVDKASPLGNKLMQELDAFTKQGTDAGTVSGQGVVNDPLALYQPATVQLMDQDGIRDAVIELTKKKGSALTPEELIAIKSEKDKAEKPTESGAPQTSIWGEIGKWFTSGADKNQKK